MSLYQSLLHSSSFPPTLGEIEGAFVGGDKGGRFYSTNRNSPQVNFREAAIKGLAPDGGLYFPEEIPVLPAAFFQHIHELSKEEVGLQVMQPYIGDCIPTDVLQQIITETVNFPFPLVAVTDQIFALELYHGPTLAFKDVGARFMSRCLGYFMQGASKKLTVLVATSGDTGGAVANGFYNVDGVDVVILYPSGKVSDVQELQLTTLGGNVVALEINGNFDDCQRLVKQAFADADLAQKLFLTSANSINVARWLPQQLYYFFALQQWQENDPPVFSVPSGNFGNICAGLLAQRSGLPIQHFVAACNANDTVPQFLESGIYRAQPAVATLSNAMDVGDPSNFVRVKELFDHQTENIRQHISGYRISDKETKETMKQLYENQHYLTDPHGAVGYAALVKYFETQPTAKGIFLETAHPIKFKEEVEEIINNKIDVPKTIAALLKRQKQSIKMEADFNLFKSFLWDRPQ